MINKNDPNVTGFTPVIQRLLRCCGGSLRGGDVLLLARRSVGDAVRFVCAIAGVFQASPRIPADGAAGQQ